MVEFGANYSEVARTDHRLFVDAFRNGTDPGPIGPMMRHLSALC